MSKFKVGDWVKCVEPSHEWYGEVLQVLSVHDNLTNNMRYTMENKSGSRLFVTELGEQYFTLTPKSPAKVESKPEGVKYDSNKRQWWFMWQFLPELEQVTDILDYGNKKYPADDGSNWRKVDNAKNRYTSAAMRHWSAWLSGEKIDAETGKSHLAHMITNLLFLMWFERNKND
jgi:hypothetical protein